MSETDTYGFMASLTEAGTVVLSDDLGGGTNISGSREDVIEEITRHIRATAGLIAEEIADDLGLEYDEEDEDE